MSLSHIGKPSPFKKQIKLFCHFCGGNYFRSMSASKNSKFCSRKCQNTVYARRQEKYSSELASLVKVYREMIRRCNNLKHTAYKNYGGRGIKVCEEWQDVNTFIADMLPSYKHGLTIERINNNGNYEPSNCRWATPKEQALNRRNTRLIEHNGLRLTLSDWARKLGVPKSRLSMRYYVYGWSIERTLS